jgi:1,4-dihydroxy-2-naphthoyl-CoA hydrolase
MVTDRAGSYQTVRSLGPKARTFGGRVRGGVHHLSGGHRPRARHVTIDDMANQTPTQYIRQLMPLCATLGIDAETVGPDLVTLSVEWSPELCTARGILHGGVIMALADSAAATCAFLNLPDGSGGTATIESKTNFLSGVRSGTVSASSRPLHVGSRTIVVETEVRSGDGRLAAKVIQTQAVL